MKPHGKTTTRSSVVAPTLPILFGDQERLLATARAGVSERDQPQDLGIVRVGLCVKVGPTTFALNGGHPAFPEIRAVLEDLLGEAIPAPAAGTAEFNRDRPLGDPNYVPFRVLLAVAQAPGPIQAGNLRKRLPDVAPISTRRAIERLVKRGALVEDDDGTLQFPTVVGGSFRRLLLRLAEISGDPLLQPREVVGARTWAFRPDDDGLPMLFATDLATRNLIALAHYGPMYVRDLRRLTGAVAVEESDETAPHTRSNVVRIWEAELGPAVMLDPAFPGSLPLELLLLRLAEAYPPPPEVRLGGHPDLPEPQEWVGDIYRLFGSPIRTKTLLTIGAYGWTFEALCHSISGLHRENVKHVIRKLEDGGILAGDRPRGPGFDVRALRIADSFPAKDELEEFLATVSLRIGMDDTVRSHMIMLLNKTKVHLLNRGLWPDDLPRPIAKSTTTILTRKNLTPEAALAVSETIKTQKALRRKKRGRKRRDS